MEYMGAGCLTDILDEFYEVPMIESEIARVCFDVLPFFLTSFPFPSSHFLMPIAPFLYPTPYFLPSLFSIAPSFRCSLRFLPVFSCLMGILVR